MKKLWATAAVAASVAGLAGAAAPQALAIGDDHGTTSFSGNGASQSFGNSATYGNMSPQLALVQGSLNKPCIGLPAKLNAQSLVALVKGPPPCFPGQDTMSLRVKPRKARAKRTRA
ncbi:rodlin [Streptomyces sp. NRRL F-2799]|uniref:rodlin n=1 Tax=Streptomyces sp. NRRL F-2799 TaxID=1463844 RepID=UPI001F3AB6B0|nr:rodlin [Streptomyces sp. NRRL F-2799]